MTSRAFAELVQELVGRNQQDFQVDRRVVLAAAEVIIFGIIKQTLDNGSTIPNYYYKAYVMQVKYDSVFERKYVEFEPPVMQIGDNDGLAYVGATLDEYDINSSYILLKPSQISQYAGLEAQHLGGRPGVRPEGNNRGYIYGIDPPSELRVLMIPQITKLKETDEMFGLDLSPIGLTEQQPDYVLRQTVNYILTKRGFREDKNTDGQSN